ncbi:hypothetical protein NBO_12g0023 [Nosema bombycis CQ1]|uniref:Uncharacterized protein n=2 Tax=Nosema bombycis TaxID=27978 RepID=R0KXJ3_NOSB1|nr:40S ribosomal protein S19 [Nosema bombycis]EOB14917.1 hypothetical protein NBO_12g0023 [Nosema bombycis CQ1]|eukprot:EOB14917.1 hypothetical protein NBO_12g0023 [Nosema bombycis CQ1]
MLDLVVLPFFLYSFLVSALDILNYRRLILLSLCCLISRFKKLLLILIFILVIGVILNELIFPVKFFMTNKRIGEIEIFIGFYKEIEKKIMEIMKNEKNII